MSVPTYDDDGNMLTDGTMTYQYDVMNQLISAETAAEKHTFKYDFEGRRYETQKWTRSGGDWTLVQTTKYVYDNWNVIAEYVNGVKVKNYVWGEDLSGTMQGAGGVGGLLAEINASGTYLPVYDGNGNILSYKDLSGNTAATYVYDPFGSVLSHTGTDFAYKFSTKQEICGLYYYGFRYYSPALGRWINRDTLKESISQNLYCFVSNDPVDAVDVLGAWGWFENQAQYHQRMNELDNLAQKKVGSMFLSMLGYSIEDDSQNVGCCGKDVTEVLNNLLNAVKKELTKEEYSSLIINVFPMWPGSGWDILQLNGEYPSIKGIFKGKHCDKTAAYNGRCYKMSVLNYALWGLLAAIKRYHVNKGSWRVLVPSTLIHRGLARLYVTFVKPIIGDEPRDVDRQKPLMVQPGIDFFDRGTFDCRPASRGDCTVSKKEEDKYQDSLHAIIMLSWNKYIRIRNDGEVTFHKTQAEAQNIDGGKR